LQFQAQEEAMKRVPSLLMLSVATAAAVLGGRAIVAQDAAKYAVQVPNGLSLGEVGGYETWQVVSITD